MKLTKTIAAVAAVALTVSAMSFAALAEVTPHSGDHEYSWTNNGDTHSGTCTKKDTDDGNEVDCSSKVENAAHSYDETTGQCVCGATKPVEHTHEAADGAEWQKDADGHWKACKDNDGGKVGSAAHTWGTGDDANKCTTCNYTKTTTPDPGPSEGGDEPTPTPTPTPGDSSEATDADKVAAAKAELSAALEAAQGSWDFSNKTIDEVRAEVGAWLAAQNFAYAENITLNCNPGDTEGWAWIGFGIVSGDVKDWSVGTAKQYKTGDDNNNDDNNDDNNNDNTSTSEPVYTPPASSDSSSPEAAEHIVESPKDVAASRKPDLTVNAAESGVSADIVTAFANNKSAKTLTLKYSSTLKVAIAKADINDAAAKLDFSVSGKKFLNTKTIQKNKALNNATKIVQLDFVSEGKLEGVDKATIKSNVGVALTGSKVTVYEYVDGKLVKVGVASVNGAGIVKFDIDHFGQFVLAVE